jgi:hypothetical protein
MNGIENATTSETDRGPADRETAGPDKARTISAAIKGLFHAAAKAITSSEDEPKPARRRRSGETEGEHRKPAHVPAANDNDRPAARGRFAVLSKAEKATNAVVPDAAYVNATAYLADTLSILDCMNPYWPPDADDNYYADEIDNEFSAKQDQNFPHL